MNHLRKPLPGLLVALLPFLVACQDPEQVLEPQVDEIPVTTASAAALADFSRGQAAMDVGRVQEANVLFESAVAKDPAFAYAYLKIAETASSTREFSDNLGKAQAHTAGKSDGELLLIEIVSTYFENDMEKRNRLARALVEKYPSSPRAWLVLAGVQSGQNQQRVARESLQRALKLDGSFKAASFATWESYLFKEPKDFARAEEAMRRCLEAGVEGAEAAKVHENLGDVYRATNQLENAREAYSQAADLDPTLAAAHIKKGHVSSFIGRFDEARADYDAGLTVAKGPNRITFANYRAFTYLHADDPQAALAELTGLVKEADASGLPVDQVVDAKIFTLSNQVFIALHHALVAEAEEFLDQLAAAMRANAEMTGDADFSRLQEAGILLWEGRLAAVSHDFETALAKAEEHRTLMASDNNPRRFEGYQGLLAVIEALRGEPRAAAEHFEQSDVHMTYFKYHLAVAKEAAGDVEDAKALFKEVAEWNFNSVGFALVRRDALSRL